MRTAGAASIMAGTVMGLLTGCGAVGSPIPPENVGVNATIERQKKLESIAETRRKATEATESNEPEPDSPLEGQDVNLPPLQPVGTR
jgi:hypothetical protein